MTLMLATAALGHVNPITVNADWGSSNGTSPQTSAVRVLTVPAGNPGVIKWTSVATSGSFEYRKNGGAYAAVVDNATVSVASSDTIQFRLTGAAFDTASINVLDNTTNTSIGSWLSLLS